MTAWIMLLGSFDDQEMSGPDEKDDRENHYTAEVRTFVSTIHLSHL